MPQAIPYVVSAVAKWWGAMSTAAKIWAVVKVVATVASVAYTARQNSKMRRAMGAALDEGRNFMVREPTAPRRIIYGQVLISGVITFIEVGGTQNEYLYLALKIADHECEELGDVYFDEEIVPLDGSGNATGKFAGVAQVRKFLGAEAGERDMTWESEISTKWTASMLGKSVARLHIRLKHDPDKFPSGIPTIRVLTKGRKIYDPRTETTAYSNNAALCAADYLMDARYGRGVALARINEDALIEAANVCDEAVSLNGGGTEARYACNGVVSSDEDLADVLASLADSMAGVIVDAGGLWTIHAGAWRAPTLTLTDDDLAGPISVSPRMSRHDSFNGVRGTYYSPENQWAAADFPAVKNDTYMAWDGGVRLWNDVAYRFTTSSATAQRLAKIELEKGRQQIVIRGKYMLRAMQCQPGDVIAITRARLGWTAKYFEVTEWRFVIGGSEDNPTLDIELTARETAEAVYDWSSDETVVDVAPNTTLLDGTDVPQPDAPTLSTSNFLQEDGTTTPRLKVELPAPSAVQVSNGGFVEIEYKKSADSTWIPWQTAPGNTTEDFITDVLAGVSYDVRIRHRNVFGARSAYSTTATVTVTGDTIAPAKPTGLAASGINGGVVLEWDDNTEADLATYEVWRRLASETNDVAGATRIWTGLASAWLDQTGANGTSYRYWIKAVDRTGNVSVASDPATASPVSPPEKVATPVITFDPPSGTTPSFTADCEITCATSGATIYYQADAGAPAVYTGVFTVTSGETVFAWAEKSGMIQSDSAMALYVNNT